MLGRVTSNQALGEGWHLLEVEAPRIARQVRAGQFVQVRIGNSEDPLIRRPFSVYDLIPQPGPGARSLQLLYLVVGTGTRWMAHLHAEDPVDLLGPLGKPMPRPELSQDGELFLIGGGIGVAPLYLYCRELRGDGSRIKHRVLLGARRAALLVALEAFHQLEVSTYCATDDGSAGYSGNVVELLNSQISGREPTQVAGIGCGPHDMNVALRNYAVTHQLPFWISLENYMPCGFGACFGCVIPAAEGAPQRYRRVCLEGPCFPARELPAEF
ncbi:MAG: dihydroorotate dehydrogenase electron transfer subunit [Planctomycetota bacterium]